MVLIFWIKTELRRAHCIVLIKFGWLKIYGIEISLFLLMKFFIVSFMFSEFLKAFVFMIFIIHSYVASSAKLGMKIVKLGIASLENVYLIIE